MNKRRETLARGVVNGGASWVYFLEGDQPFARSKMRIDGIGTFPCDLNFSSQEALQEFADQKQRMKS